MKLSFDWYKYSFVFGIQKKGIKPLPALAGGRERIIVHTAKAEDLVELSTTIKEEIKSRIREAGIKKPGKQDLIAMLRRLLKRQEYFSAIQTHAFRYAINNAIENEARIYCSVHLNYEDLQLLWHELR